MPIVRNHEYTRLQTVYSIKTEKHKRGGVMKSSLLIRLMLSTVIFALAMTAIALWLFRSSLVGIMDLTRNKAF